MAIEISDVELIPTKLPRCTLPYSETIRATLKIIIPPPVNNGLLVVHAFVLVLHDHDAYERRTWIPPEGPRHLPAGCLHDRRGIGRTRRSGYRRHAVRNLRDVRVRDRVPRPVVRNGVRSPRRREQGREARIDHHAPRVPPRVDGGRAVGLPARAEPRGGVPRLGSGDARILRGDVRAAVALRRGLRADHPVQSQVKVNTRTAVDPFVAGGRISFPGFCGLRHRKVYDSDYGRFLIQNTDETSLG